MDIENNEGRDWAVIAVADHGPGVAPEVLGQLFSRAAARPGSTGLGLGLYLSKGIATAHGGTLTVHSTPGQGATFRLSIPLAATHLPAESPPM